MLSRNTSSDAVIVPFDIEGQQPQHQPAHHGKATWVTATCVILSDVIGVGVLGLPFTVMTLGWIPGIALLCLLCLSNMYTSFLIQRLVCMFEIGDIKTYSDIGGKIGPRSRLAACVLVNAFLGAVTVLDFLTASTSLAEVIIGFGGRLSLPLCGVVVAALMLPVLQLQQLHSLTALTVLGLVTIALPLIITLARLADESGSGAFAGAETTLLPPDRSLVPTTSAVFTVVFAYCSQLIQVELMAEMPQPKTYRKAIVVSHAAIFAVYAGVSAAVYGMAGQDTTNPVTQQLAGEPTTLAVVNGMLFVHACVALAINGSVVNRKVATAVRAWRRARPAASSSSSSSFPSASSPSECESESRPGLPTDSATAAAAASAADPATAAAVSTKQLDSGLKEEEEEEAHGQHGASIPRPLWLGVSCGLLVFSFVVSNIAPDFGGLVDIIGASCGMAAAYILPCAFALALLPLRATATGRRERACLWAVLLVAAPLSALGMYSSSVLFARDLAAMSYQPFGTPAHYQG